MHVVDDDVVENGMKEDTWDHCNCYHLVGRRIDMSENELHSSCCQTIILKLQQT